MYAVFTDLDGTLLDGSDQWEAARPAIACLNRFRIPWILVSSKTRAEIEYWRFVLDNRHPFVVENGGCLYIPQRYFPFPIAGTTSINGYEAMEWGTRYPLLVNGLRQASVAADCRVRGFADMTADEVAAECGLSVPQAARAQQREYDEPFRILDAGRTEALLQALDRGRFHWTRGGRFWHICGDHDKGSAVRFLASQFRRPGAECHSLGLGDGWNDLPLLRQTSTAAVIQSPAAAELSASLGGAPIVDGPPPAAWNQAVIHWLRQTGHLS
ncbi:MAG: HAD-IIB family hydrolase [Bryobacteraceae bacterium]